MEDNTPYVDVRVIATATELLALKEKDVITMDELRYLLGVQKHK